MTPNRSLHGTAMRVPCSERLVSMRCAATNDRVKYVRFVTV